ncbi:MAG: hypothetical protein Q9N68_07080 [Gammaproteobacteria bacterium]|nr:hypothetical protein [Gammaproteobacteria bacterium]
MNAKLILFSNHIEWQAPNNVLIETLQQLQLMADPLPNRDDHYRSGERFMEHLTFVGCSPFIALQPEEAKANQTYCAIHLPQQSNHYYSAVDSMSTAPHCPHCRKAHPTWQTALQQWHKNQTQRWSCNICEKTSAPWQWNWRKQAAFGRSVIEILNIHPHEAIPSQALLDALHALNQTPWQYAYVREA